jgi:hypothetical protein
MKYRTRTIYTPEQNAQMWDRWEKGDSLHSIARLFVREYSSVFGQLLSTGGIRPPARNRSKRVLSTSEREEISRGLVNGLSLRSIATQLTRAPSTISREVSRNGGYDQYRATKADKKAWDRPLKIQVYVVWNLIQGLFTLTIWLCEKERYDRPVC